METAIVNNKAFLKNWLHTNTDTFTECMEKLAIDDPRKYCELYLKAQQLSMAQSVADTRNKIEAKRVAVSAMDKLKALSSVTDKNYQKEYAEFKEVK